MRVLLHGLAWGFTALLAEGCATGGPPRFWPDPQRGIVVTGPMLGPAPTLKELAPRLCAAIGELPGARTRGWRGAQEYCGVIYQRDAESTFYASHPSTLGPLLDTSDERKLCFPPDAVDDPHMQSLQLYINDYTGHPGIAEARLSPAVLQDKRQLYSFRVFFNPSCHVSLQDVRDGTRLQLRDGELIPDAGT
jgi:hypothetical protein